MNNNCSVNNIYKLDGRVPVLKAVPFGLQHILAMFVANLTPITIIAASAGLSQSEIAILLQNAIERPFYREIEFYKSYEKNIQFFIKSH